MRFKADGTLKFRPNNSYQVRCHQSVAASIAKTPESAYLPGPKRGPNRVLAPRTRRVYGLTWTAPEECVQYCTDCGQLFDTAPLPKRTWKRTTCPHCQSEQDTRWFLSHQQQGVAIAQYSQEKLPDCALVRFDRDVTPDNFGRRTGWRLIKDRLNHGDHVVCATVQNGFRYVEDFAQALRLTRRAGVHLHVPGVIDTSQWEWLRNLPCRNHDTRQTKIPLGWKLVSGELSHDEDAAKLYWLIKPWMEECVPIETIANHIAHLVNKGILQWTRRASRLRGQMTSEFAAKIVRRLYDAGNAGLSDPQSPFVLLASANAAITSSAASLDSL